MNEPIRLELTEEEWCTLMMAVDTELRTGLRRGHPPALIERNERIFDKLRMAKIEWEKKIYEQIHH